MKHCLLVMSAILLLSSCKTQSEIRREEELERLKQDVSTAKASKVDFETLLEESKNETARLSANVGEMVELHRRDTEELKKEMSALASRVQALEQRAVQEELAAKQTPTPEPIKATFENGKKLFDDKKYEEAITVFKTLSIEKGIEGKRSLFWLAETHFAAKDYTSAALDYAEFVKKYPKDPNLAQAIYRQAASFKGMGKAAEAKLFYQDVIEQFPKSPFAGKAKQELKKLK